MILSLINEVFRLAIGLTAPVLIFFAMYSLNRNQPSTHTMRLQITAAIWLVIAAANHALISWSRAMITSARAILPTGESGSGTASLARAFLQASMYTWLIETFAFITFAVFLLIYCRARGGTTIPERHAQ